MATCNGRQDWVNLEAAARQMRAYAAQFSRNYPEGISHSCQVRTRIAGRSRQLIPIPQWLAYGCLKHDTGVTLLVFSYQQNGYQCQVRRSSFPPKVPKQLGRPGQDGEASKCPFRDHNSFARERSLLLSQHVSRHDKGTMIGGEVRSRDCSKSNRGGTIERNQGCRLRRIAVLGWSICTSIPLLVDAIDRGPAIREGRWQRAEGRRRSMAETHDPCTATDAILQAWLTPL